MIVAGAATGIDAFDAREAGTTADAASGVERRARGARAFDGP
jgi:hypothetical protein